MGDSLSALKYLEQNRSIEDSLSKAEAFQKIKHSARNWNVLKMKIDI